MAGAVVASDKIAMRGNGLKQSQRVIMEDAWMLPKEGNYGTEIDNLISAKCVG